MVNYLFMKVKYIGLKDTINFKRDKIYEARRSPRENEKAWVGVVDESGESYGYPLNLFEIVEE